MTDRPILFSAPMVRALIEDRKTQTRRVLKPQPSRVDESGRWYRMPSGGESLNCHPIRYAVGDRLWCRETWADVNSAEGPSIAYRADRTARSWHEWCVEPGPDYGAGPSMNYEKYPGNYTMWWSDLLAGAPDHAWRPSIFMPRWASRLTLVLTDVRVQRLQDIRENDALAEGVQRFDDPSDPIHEAGMAAGLSYGIWATDSGILGGHTAVEVFARLWDVLNARRGFSSANNPWVPAISFRVEKRNIDDES
jgi:hypothetical protein